MNIGPRVVVNASDTVDQTLAATSAAGVALSLGSLGTSTAIAVAGNEAIIIEYISVSIQVREASGKLGINGYDGGRFPFGPMNLPYSFPAVNLASFRLATSGLIPVGIGPQNFVGTVTIWLTNPDTAAHSYRRTYQIGYRTVSNIDPTTGPAVPGGGTSPEFH
jgi:hypothetical protein